MSYTSTPNYSLKKPNVNSDNDVWGDHLNQDMDTLDSVIHGIDTRAAVTSFNTRTGAVTLQASDVTALGFATTTSNDASYVNVSGDTMAGPLTLSGNAVSGLQAVPLQQLNAAVPTAGNVTPAMDSVGAAGSSALYSRQDHVHPTDTSRYAASNPSGYQTAAQVTTALAPYAPLASPALTGTPTAPTVSPASDSTTKLATTAFVQSVVTGLPAYAPLANPVFTGDPRAPTPSPGDNDTSIATTAFVTNATGGLATAASSANNAGRNLLHNALFNVAQRGAGSWVASGYTLDRWRLDFALDTTAVQQTPNDDTHRAQIGDEAATNLLLVNVTGNAGAGAFTVMSQFMEDVRRLAGKTVTVSFWAYALAGTPKIGVAATQVFGTGGSPSANVNINGTPVTLSTVATRYSVTFAYPSVAGKTTGTNNDHYSRLALFFSSGATNNAFAGGIGVQTAVFLLWGVQLEVGGTATPLEKVDPGDDLRRCQRFYQVISNQAVAGSANGGATAYWTLLLPVKMRAVPSTAFGTVNAFNCTGLAIFSAAADVVIPQVTISGAGQYTVYAPLFCSADL